MHAVDRQLAQDATLELTATKTSLGFAYGKTTNAMSISVLKCVPEATSLLHSFR